MRARAACRDMSDRQWRTGVGLAALLIWSIFIGVPVLMFHTRAPALLPGDHLHAAVMFIASQVLVFWLSARPSTIKKKTVEVRSVATVPSVAAHAAAQSPWQAELVIPKPNSTPSTSAARIESLTVRVSIANYIGSGRPRRVSIEPGDELHMLLPGQELEITATGETVAPSFRIIESDLATQITVVAIGCSVSAVVVAPRIPAV